MQERIDSIYALINAFMERYNRGAFAEALELLDRQAPNYPEYRNLVQFWQGCMAARTGDVETALDRMWAGVEEGGWYHETGLRGDSDLEGLQGHPRFEPLVKLCAQRRAAAREALRPAWRALEPGPSFPKPWPLLIALHSNMSNMDLFAPYWQRAAELGWLVIVPQSTQMFWASGYYVWDDRQRALGELQAAFLEVCAVYEIDPRRVVMAGFSSGGAVAGQAALSGALQASGAILLEGYSNTHERQAEWRALAERSGPRLRMAIQSGQSEPDLLEGARELRDLLAWRGITARLYETSNTVHAMPPDFDRLLEEMLAFLSE